MTSSNRGPADVLLQWVVPILLIGLAVNQIRLALTHNLSPWKGGGFGMFAVIDQPKMRALTAEGLDSNGSRCRVDLALDGPDADARAVRLSLRLRTEPDAAAYERLADHLMASDFVRTGSTRSGEGRSEDRDPPDGQAAPTCRLTRSRHGGSKAGSTTQLRAIRLQVWRPRFDASSGRLSHDPVGAGLQYGDW